MKRLLTFCLTLALTTVVARAAELTTADAIMDFAAAKNASYESYTGAFTQSMNMPAMKMQLTGTMWFKRPAQMRMEMSSVPKLQHMVMVIGPDQVVWQEVLIGGVTNVMKMDFQNMPSNHPAATMMKDAFTQMDPKAQLIKVKQRYAFTLLPSTELHGQQMYALAGELRADAKLAPQEAAMLANMGKQKILIGQQDGFLHRMESFDKTGTNTVMAMEFTDIKLNAPLADELFVYKPAPGANVVDMSQMMLKMMSRSPKPPAAGKEK